MFLSTCACIPTAREVGIIVKVNKQVKIKWVCLTLHVDLHVHLYPSLGVLAKMEHHASSVIPVLIDGE